jgi:hypothetical protein
VAAPDPDAALHAAVPGKFRPGAPAPSPANSGTLADTIEQMPELRPVQPTMAPVEAPATFGELFGASNREAQRDNILGDERRLHDGYAPIVQALGLDPSENPAAYGELDPAGEARFGNAGSAPSRLATAAQTGEMIPFSSSRLADRPLQESLIAAEIRKRRAIDKKFLPGVPDTVDGIHKYILANEAKASRADQATLGRSPGGISSFGATLAGGAVGTFHDPTNVMTLAIPGGEGKSLVQIAARDALINGVLELGQQPIVAHQRAEIGQDYSLGDAATNTLSAAAGGAVLGGALHSAGKGLRATSRFVGNADLASSRAYQLFAALPERLKTKFGAGIVTRWGKRIADGDPLNDVFSELDNRELADVAGKVAGGAEHLTPDERDAANMVERSQDIAESSPFQPGPAGDATHEHGLAAAIKDLEDRRAPEEPGGITIQSYVDAYMRGEGRDNPEMVQFGANNGAAIEAEFHRRAQSQTVAARPVAATARPPEASSTARRPQSSSEAAIENYIAKSRRAESHGDVNADNPASSADGEFQITDGTFRGYFKRLFGRDPGEHPAKAVKNDVDTQEKIMHALTRDHAARLQSLGETVNDGNLYLMHFLGEGDGPKVFRAAADTPIERIVSPQVLEANKFLRGKSASEVIAWAHKKMGAQVASVGARPGFASNLDAASEDPAIAQLRSEALALDDAVIGTSEKPDGSRVNAYASRVPISQITVDADRFQFKAGGDEYGVTDRLKGVEELDPVALGRLTLWQQNDGRLFVADGHQRTGLVKRIAAQTGEDIPVDAVTWREADGVTAEDARTMAALKNMGENSGTVLDAAKVGRHDAKALERAAKRLPPQSALVRDARALARLSDDAFGAVYNGHIAPDVAAVIGHLLPDNPEAHPAMVDLLMKLDPANRGQAESIVRQGMAAGLHVEHQSTLFGERELVSSLMLERAKVLEKGLSELKKMRLVHKTAAENAGELEAKGSKIAKAQSEKEAQANAQAVEIVSRLAFRGGPVADALNDAARELASGAKLGSVARAFAERIRKLDLGALDREAPVDAGSGVGGDQLGRGGDAGEAGSPISAQSGDPGEPGLFGDVADRPTLEDLEAATERFSDPDGPAVKQQADSLEHDLKADIDAGDTAREQEIRAATFSGEKIPARGNRPEEAADAMFDQAKAELPFLMGKMPLVYDRAAAIAHLAGKDTIGPVHMAEALSHWIEPDLPDLSKITAEDLPSLFDALPADRDAWHDLRVEIVKERPDLAAQALDQMERAPADKPDLEAEARHAAVYSVRAAEAKDLVAAVAGGKELVVANPLKTFHIKHDWQVRATSKGFQFRMNGNKDEWFSITADDHAHLMQQIGKESRQFGEAADPAIAEDLPAKARAIAADLQVGKPSIAPGYSWRERSLLGNDVPKGGMVLDMKTPEGGREFVFNKKGELVAGPLGRAADRAALDLGEVVDPAIAERQRQQVELGAKSPLQAKTDQLGDMGLALFDQANQPTFRLSEEGGETSAEDLLKELGDDEKAIKDIKDCL